MSSGRLRAHAPTAAQSSRCHMPLDFIAAVSRRQADAADGLLSCEACRKKKTAARTALTVAAHNGHASCVKILLAHKANVSKSASDHCSPLYLACRRGSLRVAKLLIAANASVNDSRRPANGSSILHAACLGGSSEVVSLLCASGADVDAARPDGSRPLMDAVQSGHDACASTLLAAGADFAATMHHGWTALLVASLHGHAGCIRVLYAAGAPPDAADVDGTTPLCLAAQRGHVDACAALLEDAHASPNAARVDGIGALAYAAMGGHADCARRLLDARAELAALDNEGWSALLYAAHHGQLEVVSLLVARDADPGTLPKIDLGPLAFPDRCQRPDFDPSFEQTAHAARASHR